jgi:hypothetical protein
VHKYLVCEILRELDAGKTLLSQKYYAEHVLRTRCTYDYWDCIPALTPMVPGTRLTKEQCDPHPEPTFHRRRGIPDRRNRFSQENSTYFPDTQRRPTCRLVGGRALGKRDLLYGSGGRGLQRAHLSSPAPHSPPDRITHRNRPISARDTSGCIRHAPASEANIYRFYETYIYRPAPPSTFPPTHTTPPPPFTRDAVSRLQSPFRPLPTLPLLLPSVFPPRPEVRVPEDSQGISLSTHTQSTESGRPGGALPPTAPIGEGDAGDVTGLRERGRCRRTVIE